MRGGGRRKRRGVGQRGGGGKEERREGRRGGGGRRGRGGRGERRKEGRRGGGGGGKTGIPAGGALVSILLVDLITCDDDGHIVGSSSAEGQVHQASAGVLGVGVMLKNPGDRVVAHGLGQAVGAEEKGVAVEQ